MNKEELQQRIIALSNDLAQVKANYVKLEGHLEESNYWFMEILKKESEEQEQQKGNELEPTEE